MPRSIPVVLFLAAAFSLVSCKKEAPPEVVPVSTSSQAVTATATSTAIATSTTSAPVSGPDAGADGGAEAGTVAPGDPTSVVPQVRSQSIDACCAALGAMTEKKEARAANRRAMQICPGVAARVKSGQTSRADGLNLIRGSLVGATIPAACH